MGRVVKSADGFSLIEVMVSTGILTAGLLSLVGVMAIGVQKVAGSGAALIAREKAREAVESVHTARDTGELSWARVRNAAQGGDFLGGPQPIYLPGTDGLVNTADDAAAGYETIKEPGYDGLLGTSDDKLTPLRPTMFTREIAITPLTLDGSQTINPNLRQITVTVRYKVLNSWQTYTLTTFVSSYS